MTPDNYPILLSSLNERHSSYLASGLKLIMAAEEEGLLTASEYANVKYYISNVIEYAWKKFIRERYTYSGKFQNLTEEERKLEQGLSILYPHVVPGYLKKAQNATKAAGAMRDDMIALLSEIAPLAAQTVALKAKVGKRKPAPSKTSIARDERAALAMTCQCCARDILAETGVIAHHGYERPGGGYQTNSCFGARYLPFEVDREVLGDLIEILKNKLANEKNYLKHVRAETKPLMWKYNDYSQQKRAWDKPQLKWAMVTRETLPQIIGETAEVRRDKAPTFDELKTRVIANAESEIRMLTSDIRNQEARYAGWKQTHAWVDNKWEKLS